MTHFDWHRKVLNILNGLNVDFLTDCQSYFGGGTLVSLRHHEHRLSQDIDLMCSFDGYAKLRHGLYERGYDALFLNRDSIQLPRELQVSKYAVRFPILFQDTPIRFEIVAEGQLTIGKPAYLQGCSFPCINPVDSFAQKLMANADRWPDHRLLARDLIDIAVQRLAMPIPTEAISMAEHWYPVMEPLKRGLLNFQQSSSRRLDCYELLQVRDPTQVASGLDLLAHDFDLEPLERLVCEQSDSFEKDMGKPLLLQFASDVIRLFESLKVYELEGSSFHFRYDSSVMELRVRSRDLFYPMLVIKYIDDDWQIYSGTLSEEMIEDFTGVSLLQKLDLAQDTVDEFISWSLD